MTRVVFCADDLGMGPERDEGILRAAATGIVREVSLCVTGGGETAALARVARQSDAPGIGLHVSFTYGRALSGPIEGLTDPSGRFHGLPRALVSTALGRPRLDAVTREVRAQLARLRALGVEPTHLNGHHHAHVFPIIRDAVLELARELPALHLRVPASPEWSARGATLNALGRAFVGRARARGVALRSLPCLGLDAAGGDALDAFTRTLERLDGAAEWVLHPLAGPGEADGGGGLGARARQDELRVLESAAFRALLARHGVEPSRFGDA
ncbi:MAG: ChbG/HpnK family deacetylase [Polyangiaceae bacterium]|nr:ChbG/HpnK family deacetylase [Polyangiaceae bacterium]MCL4755778.1 ChbG/HpnK family deacetylase [Myxococcales bacterium]